MSYRYGKSGVGGWLALFVITLAVLRPLFTVTSILADIAQMGARFPPAQARVLTIFDIAECVTIVAGCEFLVWRLLRVPRWSTVRIVIAGLWLLALFPAFAELTAIPFVIRVSFQPLLRVLLAQHFRVAIYAGFWTAYLLRSSRVAETYPREPSEARLADVFQ